MLFKELIDQLKKVKKPEDITDELAAELTIAAIAANMSTFQQMEDASPNEAFLMTRTIILTHLDNVLIDLYDTNELDDDDDDYDLDFDTTSLFSPMNDPQFQKDMQKVMDDYNKRISKNIGKA
jgi:hypothetical protein